MLRLTGWGRRDNNRYRQKWKGWVFTLLTLLLFPRSPNWRSTATRSPKVSGTRRGWRTWRGTGDSGSCTVCLPSVWASRFVVFPVFFSSFLSRFLVFLVFNLSLFQFLVFSFSELFISFIFPTSYFPFFSNSFFLPFFLSFFLFSYSAVLFSIICSVLTHTHTHLQ